MEDFFDPEEEFEMLHATEMEMMREMEEYLNNEPVLPVPSSAKRQLSLTAGSKSSSQSTAAATSLDIIRNSSQLSVAGPAADAVTSNTAGVVAGAEGAGTQTTFGLKRPLLLDEEDGAALPAMESVWDSPLPARASKRRRPLVPEVRGCDDSITGRPVNSGPDPDLEIIAKIVQHRETLQQLALLDKGASKSMPDIIRRTKDTVNIHRTVPEGGFQAFTSNSGERVYLSMAEDESLQPDDEVAADHTQNLGRPQHRQLLNLPYQQLKDAADTQLLLQAQRIVRAAEGAADSGIESGAEDDNEQASLWTDLYRPSHYLHLLSDEMTNRTVLYWIKMWDKYVFGIDRKPRKPKENQQPKNDKWKDGKFSKFSKFNPDQKVLNELKDEKDSDGRPVQKVVLLCGPPGLGKTTLAHIIATHAGYNVVELNASDDRSVEAFRSSIENATSMRAVLGNDRRPNCLVIDEIDGAPAPSIKLLVNFISGKGLGGKAPTKKGSKEKVPVLRRPVIAICNDLYTPALRPLRQFALVVTFPPTLSSKLAVRLHEISRERGLRTDLTALMALAQKTHNDIRSCLSLLQFVRNKRGALKLTDIEGAAVGQKDYQQSLFAVWNNIFSIPRPVKVRRLNPHDLPEPSTNSTSTSRNSSAATNRPVPVLAPTTKCDTDAARCSLSTRYKDVLLAAMSCSEYDRILLGWFENYPNSKFKHTHLEPVTSGLEWAGFLDILNTEIHKSQNWSLMGYLPHVFVALHMQFATHQRPMIVFPTQHTEHITRVQRSSSLLAALLQQMSPVHRIFVGPRLLLCDLLPYLSTILQPNFRPVNTQLYSAREKAELFGVINTMLAYNLSYLQERSPEGQYSFVMEPNIEEVVHYTGTSSTTNRQLGYTARQLVAREVEIERVRRSEAYFSQQEQEKKIIPNRESIFGNASNTNSADVNVNSNVSAIESGNSGAVKKTGTVSLKDAFPNAYKKSLSSMKDTSGDQDKETEVASSQEGSSNVPNHLKKLVAKPVIKAVESRLPRDFFGRVIQLTASQQQKADEASNNDIVKSDIWFRFKEGYSNAVRRTIKLKDLQ